MYVHWHMFYYFRLKISWYFRKRWLSAPKDVEDIKMFFLQIMTFPFCYIFKEIKRMLRTIRFYCFHFNSQRVEWLSLRIDRRVVKFLFDISVWKLKLSRISVWYAFVDNKLYFFGRLTFPKQSFMVTINIRVV